MAGLLGTAAVGVDVHGIPFEGPEPTDGMELSGLPFRGSVKLGKGNMYQSVVAGSYESWKEILHKFVPHYHSHSL